MSMIKDKIILTDCDGVCLDWEYGFHTWMQAHGHELKYKDCLLYTSPSPRDRG